MSQQSGARSECCSPRWRASNERTKSSITAMGTGLIRSVLCRPHRRRWANDINFLQHLFDKHTNFPWTRAKRREPVRLRLPLSPQQEAVCPATPSLEQCTMTCVTCRQVFCFRSPTASPSVPITKPVLCPLSHRKTICSGSSMHTKTTLCFVYKLDQPRFF